MINTKKYTRPVIALILAVALLSSIWVATGSAFLAARSPNGLKADYVTFEGTAGSDAYSKMQYSYQVNSWANKSTPNIYAFTPASAYFNANKSLRFGMTDFGEFSTVGNTGLAYGSNAAEWGQTEMWASTAINPALYVQGWMLYMNYSRFFVQRQIEAYAVFSNASQTEAGRFVASWDGFSTPATTGVGIITPGSLSTSGVYVLYDSARLAVGRTTVVITDGFFNEAVAQVTFTVILNKDSKAAIIYKDVKILLDPKVLIQINDFAFSERYEIDLARNVNPSNAAYIHYYANSNTTVYMHPLTGSTTYDVLQAYDSTMKYEYFAGYWPNATEYSVSDALVPSLQSGVTRLLPNSYTSADIPVSSGGEPNTPVVTVQWRYNSTKFPNLTEFLAKSPNREIRFVEVAGMTDYNTLPLPALDVNQVGVTANQQDIEVRYILDKIFNPEDLTTISNDGNGVTSGTPADTGNFMWTAVGAGSQAVDSAGAAMMNSMYGWGSDMNPNAPMAFVDMNTTIGGTVPYALDPLPSGNSLESFSNAAKGTGVDATVFQREGLLNFTFRFYDNVSSASAEPVAGGFSGTTAAPSYWYPAVNPLTQRWNGALSAKTPYDNIYWSPNGIMTVGGPKANYVTRYFNDFDFAITREGTSGTFAAVALGGAVTGSAPTSQNTMSTVDFFPLSTWNTAVGNTTYSAPMTTFNYQSGFAVIAIARDINGTRGLSVYGWDGRDTYWASAWASQYLNVVNVAGWVPKGTVALMLNITYSSTTREPTSFSIVRCLGTITEFGDNYFADHFTFDNLAVWTPISALTVVPPLPIFGSSETLAPHVWYWAKLSTKVGALVDFDSS